MIAPPTQVTGKTMSDLFKRLDKDLQKAKEGLAFHDKNYDKLREQLDLSHKAVNRWGDDMEKLQRYVRSMVLNQEQAVQHISALEGECDELRKELYEMRQFLGSNRFIKELNEMDEHTSDVAQNEQSEVHPKSRKKRCDNPLHAVVRNVLQHLMGIDSKTAPHAPLGQGQFWTDDKNEDERLLRLTWETWQENDVVWGRMVAKKIWADGSRWSNALSAKELQKLSLAEIENAMQDQESKKVTRQQTGRKLMKAKEQMNYRKNIPELSGKEYDFIFNWKYQSTDESDDDDEETGPIDADTSGDDTAQDKPSSKQCP
ncbi:uncharacterized protein LAESUDRAFT_757750 [Laetiporus sulphureus 93-53]|uniref:Uncharacterized protein n=1 Tax=Laetiporus sulphureus 93-53 TaxID=1314785 RepID=A0A165F752_9APHY|nr:uncharacterized protein LAESUDRAFT_757750 [Laetiporus sulphureus 93-53]KZT08518.1 hypothetical protein LAESUDRAFT_757750 [Laetiporus sulphureus 93-53]